MLDALLIPLTFAALLGCALMAGTFYAFSTFVMRALARIPGDAGTAAMQSINVAVINPMFLGVFLGNALACAVLVASAVLRWGRPGVEYVIAGALLYVLGTFGVTIVCNVPLNNALARLQPTDPDAAARWAEYLSRWTAWNHVRAVAALVAVGSFALALRKLP
jgi:uncharacterized membrane protein